MHQKLKKIVVVFAEGSRHFVFHALLRNIVLTSIQYPNIGLKYILLMGIDVWHSLDIERSKVRNVHRHTLQSVN